MRKSLSSQPKVIDLNIAVIVYLILAVKKLSLDLDDEQVAIIVHKLLSLGPNQRGRGKAQQFDVTVYFQ